MEGLVNHLPPSSPVSSPSLLQISKYVVFEVVETWSFRVNPRLFFYTKEHWRRRLTLHPFRQDLAARSLIVLLAYKAIVTAVYWRS